LDFVVAKKKNHQFYVLRWFCDGYYLLSLTCRFDLEFSIFDLEKGVARENSNLILLLYTTYEALI
jgi:hypothetical protein